MALAPDALASTHCDATLDRDLVEAHRRGDPQAFAAIVHAHHSALLASARRRLGSADDAEDAVQETLLRAFRGLDRFGSEGDWRLGAWLGRILANVCVDLGGGERRRQQLHLRVAATDDRVERDVADLVADPVALDAVRRALAGLPTTQRRAFELRVVDDLPYPQVAETLGISEDNARARVRRARVALRRALDDTAAVPSALVAAPLALLARRRLRRGAPRTGGWFGGGRRPARRPVGRASRLRQIGRPVAIGGRPHPGLPGRSHLVSAASQTAAGTPSVLPVTSSLSAPVASAASGPVNAGLQLVAQVAASPVGQAALSLSSTPGKGAMVLGLAASLATAGALSLPAHGNPTQSAGAERAAAVLPTTVAGATTSPAAPTVSPAGDPTTPGSSEGAASSSDPSPSATPAPAASTPLWVTAAAGATATSGSTAGFESPTATPAGNQTAAKASEAGSSAASAPATAGSSSGAASSNSTASGGASAGGSTAGSGASTDQAAGGDHPGSTTAGTSSASSSSSTPTAVLPPGTCTAVAGFPTLSATGPPPPLTSVDLVDLLDTGVVTGTGAATGPALSTSAAVRPDSQDAGVPVQVDAGTCLGQGGSLLAVDLTGAGGDEVELTGSLVAEPTVSAPGGGTPVVGQPTDTTYLFRGTVQQVAGVFQEGTLPWGLPPTFVAELQVDEPAGTDELTVAFVVPTSTGTTSPAPTGTAGGSTTDGTTGASGPAPAAGGGPSTTSSASDTRAATDTGAAADTGTTSGATSASPGGG